MNKICLNDDVMSSDICFKISLTVIDSKSIWCCMIYIIYNLCKKKLCKKNCDISMTYVWYLYDISSIKHLFRYFWIHMINYVNASEAKHKFYKNWESEQNMSQWHLCDVFMMYFQKLFHFLTIDSNCRRNNLLYN